MKKVLLLALLFGAQLSFGQGKQSGIVGQSVIFCCPVSGPGHECLSYPYGTTIAVYSEKGRLVETITTDENGFFTVNLKPGLYTLAPAGPPQPASTDPDIPPLAVIYPAAYPVEVRVDRKQFTAVIIFYDCGAI